MKVKESIEMKEQLQFIEVVLYNLTICINFFTEMKLTT